MRKRQSKRQSLIKRKTEEVDIKVKLVINGKGKTKIKTGYESLDHLLTLFAFHGLFDLTLEAKGDLRHHIVEDIAIALGKAFKEALKDSTGIKRYGYASIPMDEILAKVKVSIDLGGRDLFAWHNPAMAIAVKERLDLTSSELKDFLEKLTKYIGMNLHVEYLSKQGEIDTHHLFEAVFKALGLSLDQATQIDPRRKGIPSTKGIID